MGTRPVLVSSLIQGVRPKSNIRGRYVCSITTSRDFCANQSTNKPIDIPGRKGAAFPRASRQEGKPGLNKPSFSFRLFLSVGDRSGWFPPGVTLRIVSVTRRGTDSFPFQMIRYKRYTQTQQTASCEILARFLHAFFFVVVRYKSRICEILPR